MNPLVFYFGILNPNPGFSKSGHYWHTPPGQCSINSLFSGEEWIPQFWTSTIGIDGGWAPRFWASGFSSGSVQDPKCCFIREGVDHQSTLRIKHFSEEHPQGVCLLHHLPEYSMISWWDRTQGDPRPGCNGNFIVMKENAPFQEMIRYLKSSFPEVIRNLDHAGIELREIQRISK